MSELNLKPSLILLLSTILVLCSSIRTDTNPTPSQYSSQTYANSLDQIQTRFENQIKTLNQQINDINSIISNANTSTSVKVTSISQKMADQRNSLYDVQQSLKLPYQLKLCQCRQLTQLQKSRLLNKTIDISNNITSLQQDVSKCAEITCPNNNYIKQQLKNLKLYLDSVKQILNSDCCRKRFQFKQQTATGIVNLQNTLFKDNLKAGDWFYGSTTEQDYKLKMFQLSTKYNVTTCPINLPFANYTSNKCMKCEQEGAIFNIGVRSCYYCGKFAFLNKNTSLCTPCPTQQQYDFKEKKCTNCNVDQFLNTTSQQCEPCPTGQFYDIDSSKCTSCPQNNQYDTQKRVCRACNATAAEFFNSTTLKCQPCPKGYQFNVTTTQCELCPNNGYFVRQSGKCVPCTGNLFLNPKTMRCQQCPSDTYFNKTMKKCVKCPRGSRFDSVFQKCINLSNLTNSTNSTTNNNTNTTNSTNNTNPADQCPSDHPHYNRYLNRCQQCPHDQIYDYNLGKCVEHNNIGICPDDQPYFDINKNQCIACPAGTTFNSYSFECQAVQVHHRHSLAV